VTQDLPIGYYGGVSVVDSGRILYHAYKPQSADQINLFRNILDTYQVVDISNLEIYLYNMNTKVETNLTTRLNARSLNPAYTNDQTLLFETNAGSMDASKYSMYQVKLDGTDATKVNLWYIRFLIQFLGA
jgi:hypothetical protein